jgi:hypothetical protein
VHRANELLSLLQLAHLPLQPPYLFSNSGSIARENNSGWKEATVYAARFRSVAISKDMVLII